jgi:hypothetical protein
MVSVPGIFPEYSPRNISPTRNISPVTPALHGERSAFLNLTIYYRCAIGWAIIDWGESKVS